MVARGVVWGRRGEGDGGGGRGEGGGDLGGESGGGRLEGVVVKAEVKRKGRW